MSLPPITVEALFKFDAYAEDELSFEKGDSLGVTGYDNDSWWTGELNGRTGFIPSNYVIASESLSSPRDGTFLIWPITDDPGPLCLSVKHNNHVDHICIYIIFRDDKKASEKRMVNIDSDGGEREDKANGQEARNSIAHPIDSVEERIGDGYNAGTAAEIVGFELRKDSWADKGASFGESVSPCDGLQFESLTELVKYYRFHNIPWLPCAFHPSSLKLVEHISKQQIER